MVSNTGAHILKLSDRILILRCQAGDDDAFARLYGRFSERTLRYLRGIMGPGAEDVHQEVWMQVFKRLSSLESPDNFRTWLFQVTRNRAIDHLRRQQRHNDLFVDHLSEISSTLGNVEDNTDSIHLEVDLAASIRQLSPKHREVVTLRYLEGMSYAEIAGILGAPVGTIRSRLHHAREALRVVAGSTSQGTSE